MRIIVEKKTCSFRFKNIPMNLPSPCTNWDSPFRFPAPCCFPLGFHPLVVFLIQLSDAIFIFYLKLLFWSKWNPSRKTSTSYPWKPIQIKTIKIQNKTKIINKFKNIFIIFLDKRSLTFLCQPTVTQLQNSCWKLQVCSINQSTYRMT